MTNELNKFKLLMWKNWTLLRRRPFASAFEIIFPVIVCMILVAIRGTLYGGQKDEVIFDPFEPEIERPWQNIFMREIILGYSPRNPFLGDILTTLCVNTTESEIPEDACSKARIRIVDFKNAAELNNAIDNDLANLSIAVQFDDSLSEVTDSYQIIQISPNLDVTIRPPSEYTWHFRREWYTNLLFPTFQTTGPRNSTDYAVGNYTESGFLYLQQAIALAIINNGSSINPFMRIYLNRYPYPSWVEDNFYSSTLQPMVTTVLMISVMYNYINTIRSITSEKEKQLKESMKIMGLPGWLHWTAWFMRSFVILLIVVAIVTVILTVQINQRAVFVHSDASVLFVFLLLFVCSLITFCFFVSVFFSKANTAAAVGTFLFLLKYLPYMLQQQADTLSLGAVLASSLLPNSGLAFGLTIFLKFEAIEEGVQWSNVWSSASLDDTISLGPIMLMFVLDAFLYLVLALYVEAIFPGEFGVPEPWYYPLTRTYWCNNKLILDHDATIGNEGEFFEEFNENLPVGIQLKNLSKTFGSNRAVEKINLDMYEGHITVLLGHNGAGKTTTMSMITGMFPPTKGTALVDGYDVRKNVGRVRDSMGLCLQHNVLFDTLTVYEHLYFFGKLKGLQKGEIEREIDKYIKLLELENKRNAASMTLSGGMKRKLSLGIALCGRSRVIMLDEPTSGMDPSARRVVWNLLQKEKQGRTILLTTHFMDEADLLGDRIAIMTAGEVQCCGSSFFLKRKYGAGYYLIMDVLPGCRPENVTRLLGKHIPHIKIHSHVGSELSYQLSESDSAKFEKMLGDLEDSVAQLGVQSYGMSLTTLEEVFLKVGADHDTSTKNNSNGFDTEIRIDKSSDFSASNYLTGLALLKNQFVAMAMKKFLATFRMWYLFLIQIIWPIALLVVTILIGKGYIKPSNFPPRRITLESYDDPVTLLSGSNSYASSYKEMLNGHQVSQVSNISEEILKLTAKSSSVVKRRYIVGADFNDSAATAWFNGDPYHSTPLSLSLILNTLYKQTFGMDKSINFINHPLPLSVEAQLRDFYLDVSGFQISIIMGYGMAFVASFYILFCIKERVSKSKHLQFVSGMNVAVFWGTAFICDLVAYLFTIVFFLIALVALQPDGFQTADEIGRTTVVLVYYGFNVLPLMYLAAYLFTLPAPGFSRTMVFGILTGVVGIVAVQLLEAFNKKNAAKPLNWVLLFTPVYGLAKGVYDLSAIHLTRKMCEPWGDDGCENDPICCDVENFYSFDSPGIGRNLVISFSMSVLFFTVLLINENGFFGYVLNRLINFEKPPVQDSSVESDVAEENNTIRNTQHQEITKTYSLVLKDVTKYYGKLLAVNGLCLGVKPFECFGLLGVNGAGKTSTFKMITGDEQISYGNAWVKGLDTRRQQKKVQKLIGYCPQFDGLLDDLTARETLKIFALIRGIPYSNCRNVGEALAKEYDFYKHLDKQVKELSGGNKRKLSTALALIGDPPIVYLDEPTTGMDPATKRYFWTAIGKLRDRGKCIVLTSHSMEECEALCTRIAIMVNGRFQCLGSTQRLKNKFAQGYSLTIKLKKDATNLRDNIARVDEFVQKRFAGAELKETHQELLSYQLVNNSLAWSTMFGILEKHKKGFNIEDYALGQCSLEQVFLSFTKHQE